MKKILVVGDSIIDKYTYVTSTRRAAEADIPVYDVESEETRPGGALNVTANIASLSENAEIQYLGVVDDEVSDIFLRPVFSDKVCECASYEDSEVLLKHRVVLESEIISRIDYMKSFASKDVARVEKAAAVLNECGFTFDAVVYSDYGKGAVTDEVVRLTMPLSKLRIVDSKRKDLSVFRGCEVLKLNSNEYGDVSSFASLGKAHSYTCVEEIFGNVVVTKGENGAELRIYDESLSKKMNSYAVHTEIFKTRKRNALDVTGCGDTHLAALVVSLVNGADIRSAVRFANERAGDVVEVFGTAICKK